MTTGVLEEKKIHRIVKKAVTEAFQDFLGDPDVGLEIQERIKQRLSKKQKKGISLEMLSKKYL